MMASADRPVFLVADNARVYHAKVVSEFVESTGGRLRLFYFPAYSPELNPDELVWNQLKTQDNARSDIRDFGDLKRTALGGLRSLPKLIDKVARFFKKPELAYIFATE